MKKWIFIIFVLVLFRGGFALAQSENIEIDFFYGQTCPHCAAEQEFLDELEEKYPDVQINRYLITEPQSQEILFALCEKCHAEQYIGLVPLTFIGEEFFVGFDSPAGIGKKIEEVIQSASSSGNEGKITLPFVGQLNTKDYSFSALAVILGTLDGFNVCSLGALVLILGLVLALRSRTKTLIFGGLFVLTTAFIYGLLIVFWYRLFSFFAPYLKTMEVLIGCLGVGGGIYFLRQFLKFRKKGAACEIETGKGIKEQLSSRIQKVFQERKNILLVIGIVLLFAVVITVVEFPCSAVAPVIFAGMLAKADLTAFSHFYYIALFVLFYMLDEIIVFLIAVFTMTVWLTSSKLVTWLTLVEAVILFLLGLYYLI